MSVNSHDYWVSRYENGGNSGVGSKNVLNLFKTTFTNSLIEKLHIKSIIDFGCGDGNFANNIRVSKYVGVDVSTVVLDSLKNAFQNDASREFYLLSEQFNACELSISMDVIYHLIDQSAFEDYMKHLFKFAERYVLIYSSNFINLGPTFQTASHIKHRDFDRYVPDGFSFVQKFENLFPYDPEKPNSTSWSDFWLYKRIN